MWHLTILAFYGMYFLAALCVAGAIVACYEWYRHRKQIVISNKRHVGVMQDFSSKHY